MQDGCYQVHLFLVPRYPLSTITSTRVVRTISWCGSVHVLRSALLFCSEKHELVSSSWSPLSLLVSKASCLPEFGKSLGGWELLDSADGGADGKQRKGEEHE